MCRFQKKRGLKLIDSVFQLLNLLMVRVNQKERLSLHHALMIIKYSENFYESMLKIIN